MEETFELFEPLEEFCPFEENAGFGAFAIGNFWQRRNVTGGGEYIRKLHRCHVGSGGTMRFHDVIKGTDSSNLMIMEKPTMMMKVIEHD